MDKIDNLSVYLNENIKSVKSGNDIINLEWEKECTETNKDEDDFLMDIESVLEGGQGDWEFDVNKCIKITTEHIYESINEYDCDIRSYVYTDDMCNINRILLIID